MATEAQTRTSEASAGAEKGGEAEEEGEETLHPVSRLWAQKMARAGRAHDLDPHTADLETLVREFVNIVGKEAVDEGRILRACEEALAGRADVSLQEFEMVMRQLVPAYTLPPESREQFSEVIRSIARRLEVREAAERKEGDDGDAGAEEAEERHFSERKTTANRVQMFCRLLVAALPKLDSRDELVDLHVARLMDAVGSAIEDILPVS